MAQYIDKDALMAEIERIENELNHEIFTDECLGKRLFCCHIKSFINTLEVKDVNINKEISQFIDANFEKATIGHKLSLRRVAKHFFELGLKAQKGEYMTQEEKLEEAKRLYETANAGQRYVLEQLFPELKESESDRIRKSLIEWMEDFPDTIWKGHYKKDVISWLEKQGKKPQGKSALEAINEEKVDNANKVESKFKVGDWVVRGNITAQILDVQEQYYVGIDTNGNDFTSSRFLNDDKIHLWTISDAKDGDILVDEDNNIGIYRGKVDAVDWLSYIYLGCDNHFYGFNIGGYHNIKNTKPATKEQRDQLEKAMGEVGYDFDFNKKELKKIERIFAEDSCKNSDDIITEEKDRTEYKKGFECGKQRVLKYPEDFGLCKKHAWSEEDEYLLGETIQHLEELIRIEKVKHCGIDVQYYQRDIDWLKSLKERLQIQPKQKR